HVAARAAAVEEPVHGVREIALAGVGREVAEETREVAERRAQTRLARGNGDGERLRDERPVRVPDRLRRVEVLVRTRNAERVRDDPDEPGGTRAHSGDRPDSGRDLFDVDAGGEILRHTSPLLALGTTGRSSPRD